jgi:hypothetical protein
LEESLSHKINRSSKFLLLWGGFRTFCKHLKKLDWSAETSKKNVVNEHDEIVLGSIAKGFNELLANQNLRSKAPIDTLKALSLINVITKNSIVYTLIRPYERVNYTILGDHVNQAQRLERVNRRFGTQILVSKELIEALGDAAQDYLIVLVDNVLLRGFSTPIQLFEVLAKRSEATPEQQKFAASIDLVRQALLQGRGDEALAAMSAIPKSMQSRSYVKSLYALCGQQSEEEL